jgi:hypothetical protein
VQAQWAVQLLVQALLVQALLVQALLVQALLVQVLLVQALLVQALLVQVLQGVQALQGVVGVVSSWEHGRSPCVELVQGPATVLQAALVVVVVVVVVAPPSEVLMWPPLPLWTRSPRRGRMERVSLVWPLLRRGVVEVEEATVAEAVVVVVEEGVVAVEGVVEVEEGVVEVEVVGVVEVEVVVAVEEGVIVRHQCLPGPSLGGPPAPVPSCTGW